MTPSAKQKPCGNSYIPKTHKCSKKASVLTPKAVKTAATVALAAGLVTGGAYLAKRNARRTRPLTVAERRGLVNKQKLSPERARKITDEAINGGKVWDVQEKINARRRAMECGGGGMGKLAAPAKFDALIPNPRCQAGEGAFGAYFVHPSEKFGVKLYRNLDEDDVDWGYDRLDKAHAAGVNVLDPFSMNASPTRTFDVCALRR